MSLKKMSNKEFEIRLREIIKRERQILHLLLIHLIEADRRRLYVDYGRNSLFEYLVKDFGYSESAAIRRIQAARLSLTVPSLPEKIKLGQISLVQVGELTRALRQAKSTSPKQKQELIEQISGQNTLTTQRIISQQLNIELRPAEKTQVQKDESVNLQLNLTKEQYEKLMKCKDLAAATLIQNGKTQELAQVIEVMADKMLGRQAAPPAVTSMMAAKAKVQKSVTPKLRKQILQRDKSCCYKFKNGFICGSTFNLQIDHIKPKWAGGGQDPENLQVLCAAHNRHRYRAQAGFT